LKKMTYAKSGVDIFKEEKAIEKLVSNIKHKRKGIGRPLGGHYAGMIEFGEYALVLCTDGVGSKVEIASQIKKYDTVGIDCIAMNVNDAICVGAEPLAFVDYLAINNPDPKITNEIGRGLAKGAELSDISIIGGETASLPDIINGFDLAGTCLAYVEKDKIITGDKIGKKEGYYWLHITGDIENTGSDVAENVRVWAIFYDSSGNAITCRPSKFVNDEHLDNLYSGEARPIDITYSVDYELPDYELLINYDS